MPFNSQPCWRTATGSGSGQQEGPKINHTMVLQTKGELAKKVGRGMFQILAKKPLSKPIFKTPVNKARIPNVFEQWR